MRARAAWLALALLAGCSRDSPARRFPRMTLASSVSTGRAPKDIPVVVVSKTALSIEGGAKLADVPANAATDGFDGKDKRAGARDMYIQPLGDALMRKAYPPDVGFAFDGSTPYRVVTEVLYTAGQTKVTADHLLAAGQDTVVDVVSHPPRSLPPPSSLAAANIADLPTLAPSIFLLTEGVAIKAGGRNIAAGCTSFGPGMTVPTDPKGGFDPAVLYRCVVALKGASPAFAAEKQLVLTASGTTPWSQVMSVADLLRQDKQGAPLFPDVIFGVAR